LAVLFYILSFSTVSNQSVNILITYIPRKDACTKHFLFIMVWVLMIGGCSEPRHRFFPGRLRFLAQGASRRFTQWP